MATQSTTLTTPYSHDSFHQIQDIEDIKEQLNQKHGDAFVNTTLAPIFKKHDVEEVLGVGLVHRHFSISPNEKLVEFNNITSPWSGIKLGSNHSAKIPNSANGLVTETSWALDANDKWMPFEFSFDPHGTTTIVNLEDAKYQAFLQEYTTALQENGFDKVLGLTAWPGAGYTGGLEFCSGRGNIVLTPDQTTNEDGDANNIQTAWFWHPEWLQPYKGKKKSNRCCCDKAGPHGANHAEWAPPQEEMKKSKRCCCDKAGPHGANHAEWAPPQEEIKKSKRCFCDKAGPHGASHPEWAQPQEEIKKSKRCCCDKAGPHGASHPEWAQPQQEIKNKECTMTRAGHITTLAFPESQEVQPQHDEVKSKRCVQAGAGHYLAKDHVETNGTGVQGMEALSLKCHVSAAGHHECT